MLLLLLVKNIIILYCMINKVNEHVYYMYIWYVIITLLTISSVHQQGKTTIACIDGIAVGIKISISVNFYCSR